MLKSKVITGSPRNCEEQLNRLLETVSSVEKMNSTIENQRIVIVVIYKEKEL